MRKMIDSGVPWIGEIPEGWCISPLKYNYNMVAGGTPDSTKQNFWDGDINWITPADYKTKDIYVSSGKRNLSKLGYQACSTHMLPTGSIVVSKRAPIGSVAISQNELCTNQGCLGLVKKNESVDNKYFYYVLSISDDILNLFGSGTTFKEVSAAVFSNIVFPCPNIKLQHRIADFLDSKCSEIDSLIQNLQGRKEGVKEYRKAVITEAVTKGLDKDVKMRDSGIPWVGEIPEEWNISRLGYECYIRARLGWKGLKADEYVDEGYAFISAFNIQNDKLIWTPLNFITKERYDESPEIKLHVGDVLIVKDGAGAGKCARVDSLPLGETAPNSSIGVLTSNGKMEYRYLAYYLQSNVFNNMVLKVLNGMGVPHLTQEMLRKSPVVLPSMNEQHRIADYLDAKCFEIDTLLQNYDEQITALEEYKKSLIYEYITGKKILTSNNI